MTIAMPTPKTKKPKPAKLIPDELIDQLLAQLDSKDAESILGESGLAGLLKKQLAERMRAAIEHNEVVGTGVKQPIRCTATLGASGAFTAAQDFDAFLQLADAALYRGKTQGRNRVEWAGGVERSVQIYGL